MNNEIKTDNEKMVEDLTRDFNGMNLRDINSVLRSAPDKSGLKLVDIGQEDEYALYWNNANMDFTAWYLILPDDGRDIVDRVILRLFKTKGVGEATLKIYTDLYLTDDFNRRQVRFLSDMLDKALTNMSMNIAGVYSLEDMKEVLLSSIYEKEDNDLIKATVNLSRIPINKMLPSALGNRYSMYTEDEIRNYFLPTDVIISADVETQKIHYGYYNPESGFRYCITGLKSNGEGMDLAGIVEDDTIDRYIEMAKMLMEFSVGKKEYAEMVLMELPNFLTMIDIEEELGNNKEQTTEAQ